MRHAQIGAARAAGATPRARHVRGVGRNAAHDGCDSSMGGWSDVDTRPQREERLALTPRRPVYCTNTMRCGSRTQAVRTFPSDFTRTSRRGDTLMTVPFRSLAPPAPAV